ncbi:SHOCT domain-containing protein [Aminipila butyrica]|uniref:SHOCT domain-containing protein n=1 Tax=Aminipila butyrica TaxID=433296 RepID=A0A858BTV3_9FIRM|nr:SHOCT domain-containing protein [Aminipila butyrica]QIB68619.1 SHOCT domain-containing protein [Aminipila butyrica]
MGIFLVEKCSLCGNTDQGADIADGYLCRSCLKRCGPFLPHLALKTKNLKQAEKAMNLNEINKSRLSEFSATKVIGQCAEFDENNRYWMGLRNGPTKSWLDPIVYKFDDIVNFELLEDGESVTKGGLGMAAIGGLVYGGVGAIVGSVVGKKKTKSSVNSLKIKITVRNNDDPAAYIDIFNKKLMADSSLYRQYFSEAQEILSMLSIITESNKPCEPKTSVADELLKFKELLDAGILTQDEFNREKEKLLK